MQQQVNTYKQMQFVNMHAYKPMQIVNLTNLFIELATGPYVPLPLI